MFEIVPVEVDVPTELAPMEEIESIVNELLIGESLRERAMFRFWRIRDSRAYLEVREGESDNGVPRFATFEEFVEYFCHIVDISRAKIFSRIRTYSELHWLEFTDEEMLKMMSNRPGLYSKTLNKIFNWNSLLNIPMSLKTDSFGDPDEPENPETKAALKKFIEELGLHDSVTNALEMVDKDILGKPEVSMFFSGEYLVVRFDQGYVTEDGVEIMEDVDEIYFETDTELPGWVTEEMERKYKIKTQ